MINITLKIRKNKFHKFKRYIGVPFINLDTKLLISPNKISTVKVVSAIYDIQYKIRVNKAHMKNDGNEINLETESTENTADTRIYTAIFRI